ncbi:EAL domain-containing protein (putative c-di-GMP-specific phosphodiesterase class I) [Rhizobium sp. PP-CC-3A-592]|nr:EAL domain-containing protein (putative c-di-GMP-specific phosphodiesterase class I) [Rhizobium sp. PP-CC-3A-592]
MADLYAIPLNWQELRMQVLARKTATYRQVDRTERPNAEPISTNHASDRFPAFTIAFQPIINVETGTVFAQEALTRSLTGGGAASVFGSVSPRGMLTFEALCRKKAIRTAAACGLDVPLSLNISPAALTLNGRGAVDTLRFAEQMGLRPDALILEVTENGVIDYTATANAAMTPLRQQGLQVAIDDFGAGHNGLQAFVDIKPDIVKMDITLIRDLSCCEARQTLVHSIVECCERLGIKVIAEGVETIDQARTLRSLGVVLMQGFLLARPQVEQLPQTCREILNQIEKKG